MIPKYKIRNGYLIKLRQFGSEWVGEVLYPCGELITGFDECATEAEALSLCKDYIKENFPEYCRHENCPYEYCNL